MLVPVFPRWRWRRDLVIDQLDIGRVGGQGV